LRPIQTPIQTWDVINHDGSFLRGIMLQPNSLRFPSRNSVNVLLPFLMLAP